MLAIAAGVPVIVGAWALFASGLVLSREMTWDLLFNLEGAWHIEHGHVPHRDFHDPLGPLSFILTNLGFRFAGPTAMAFIVGELIALAMLFPMAVVAAAGRLAPLPAFLVVLYVGLLILQPANVGDLPYAYSFAMSYNRWAWAALTILGLLLFVDPRRVKGRPWLDLAMAGGLVIFLFYLKITFAVVAIGGMVAAIATVRRVREQWPWWTGVVVLIVLTIAAPFNHSYLRDTWQFAMSGYARVDMLGHLNVFAANRAELSLYAVTIGLLVWLWQSGRGSFEVVVSAGLLAGIGMFVLSQNAQEADIPVGIVITLLAYNTVAALCRGPRALRPSELTTILLIVLVWPADVGRRLRQGAGGLLSRHHPAPSLADAGHAQPSWPGGARSEQRGVGCPRAGGLPAAEHNPGTTAARSAGAGGVRRVAGRSRRPAVGSAAEHPGPRPGQSAAIRARLPAAAWQHAVAVAPGTRCAAPHEIFDDVDVVLVPKYSTYAPCTAFLLDAYGGFLAQTFPVRTETASWTFLRRSVPRPSE